MLETCSIFASDFDLQINSSKSKCMYLSKNNKDEHDNIYFMNTPIEFMKSTQLLGVHHAAEHFIYVDERINVILSILFNCFISHLNS